MTEARPLIVRPVIAMGREKVPLHVIDDAHPAPRGLCAAAARSVFERSDDFYPGLRAPAPDGYADWLEAAMAVIGWAVPETLLRCSYAIATDKPAELDPIQRIPHFDTLDPWVMATVHYLCDAPHQGTSFYRHRGTHYERIDASRQSAWRQGLTQDRRDHGLPPPRYASESSAAFERIGQAELRFNRLIIYPANCLHAGDLGVSDLRSDPAYGRLTVTSLFRQAR